MTDQTKQKINIAWLQSATAELGDNGRHLQSKVEPAYLRSLVLNRRQSADREPREAAHKPILLLSIKNAHIVSDLVLAFLDLPVFLRFENCHFAGGLDISNAHIKGLKLSNCSLAGILALQYSHLSNSLEVLRTELERGANIEGVHVAHDVIMCGSTFDSGSEELSINGNKMFVGGELNFGSTKDHGGCIFHGTASFIGATIHDQISFINSKFTCRDKIEKNGYSLILEQARVGGSVICREHYENHGIHKFSYLRASALIWEPHRSTGALIVDNSIIDVLRVSPSALRGDWTITGLVFTTIEVIDSDRVGQLTRDPGLPEVLWNFLRSVRPAGSSTPAKPRSARAPTAMKECHLNALLDWIKRSGERAFTPQPYKQLAECFEKGGHFDFATATLSKLSEEWHRNRVSQSQGLYKITNYCKHLLSRLVGYGYKPENAILGLFATYLLAALFFQYLYDNIGSHIFSFDGEPELFPGKSFIVSAYTLDRLLPFLDLGMEKHYRPNLETGYTAMSVDIGWIIYVVDSSIAFLGWFLSSLWISSITGIIKPAKKH